MINEERVKHMTNMAIFEKNEASSYMIAAKYKKKDYLTRSILIEAVILTILFLMGYLFAVAMLLSTLIVNVNTIGFIIILVVGIVLYVITLHFNLQITRKRAEKRYAEGKANLGRLYNDMDKLTEMYEKEEAERTISLQDDYAKNI